MKKRKCSYQNASNAKRIEIEENNSIEVKKHKVSYKQIKKTVIYGKEGQKNSNLQKNRKWKEFPKVQKPRKISDWGVKEETKRSRSARSTSRREQSDHSPNKIHDYIENQKKKKNLKEKKALMKEKHKSYKMKKELSGLNSFVSKKFMNGVYNDKTYDGLIPQEISKQLKKKRRESKTPRSMMKNIKLSFGIPRIEKSNSRPNTAASFYPLPSHSLGELKYSPRHPELFQMVQRSLSNSKKHSPKPISSMIVPSKSN
jgi:hypothetical protein